MHVAVVKSVFPPCLKIKSFHHAVAEKSTSGSRRRRRRSNTALIVVMMLRDVRQNDEIRPELNESRFLQRIHLALCSHI